jgi:glycosyltransferase involved in cell wall biosynthesis
MTALKHSSPSHTSKIAIAICTHNRGAGLSALLAVLGKQRLPGLCDRQIFILIIDNSASGDAKAICSAFNARGRFHLEYFHEPRRGLAFARNAAIATARACSATHIAFIDDDELPHPDWLQSLFDSLETMQAAAAVGPVYPLFVAPPAAWLPLKAFVTRRPPKAGLVNDGYTCNCIIAMSAIERSGLAFEVRFNETGGEDTVFFKNLIDRGGRIAWAEEAVVHDVVPGHRMSAAWLCRRWYRTGAIEAELAQFDPASLHGRLYNLVRGFARIAVGGLYVVKGAGLSILGRPEAFVASFYTLCRGAGLVASVFGSRYKEYTVQSYR